MFVKNNDLEKIQVNVYEEEIINLLNRWCMDDYQIFGSILNVIADINKRIILLNYNKNNNSFITFDSHISPLNISLIMNDSSDDMKKIIINRYDNIGEYSYDKDCDGIYIDEIKKNNNCLIKKKIIK